MGETRLIADFSRPDTLLRALVVVSLVMVCGVYFLDRSRAAREISAEDFGAAWPWPEASRAVLLCRVAQDTKGAQRASVQVVLNGSVYALNATAIETTGRPDSRQMMGAVGQDDLRRAGRRRIVQIGRSICGMPHRS